MLKEWTNTNLGKNGTKYVYIPNKSQNTVLTEDGVYINYEYFMKLEENEYLILKQHKGIYDYEKTRQFEKLTYKDGFPKMKITEKGFEALRQNKIQTEQDSIVDESTLTVVQPKVEKQMKVVKELAPKKEKVVKVVKTENKDEDIFTKTTNDKIEIKETVSETKPKKTVRKSKKNSIHKIKKMFDGFGKGFSFVSKLIMFVVCVGTGILSIYYTGTYMSQIIENTFIGYLISATMYSYGLIGLNYSDIFKEQKKIVLSWIFLLTALCTIAFSMCTSLFVNGEKFYVNKVEVSQTKVAESKASELMLENISEQIESKKKLISGLENQNETLSTTWSVIWDSERKTNVVVEGKLSEKAQDNINKNNELIVQYTNDINELQNKKLELISEGVSAETNEQKIETFTELIAKYLHFDANFIQLFLILFSSVFIDLISPLALCVVRSKDNKNN